MPKDQDHLQEELRRRYWESDESVNRIAEDLGISKGRLYGMIPLLRVTGACPACRVPGPGFTNRTARDVGELTCVLCGWTGTEAELAPLEEGTAATSSLRSRGTVEAGAAGGASAGDAGGAPVAGRAGGAGTASLQGIDTTSIVGGALVGLAAGLLLGGWLRR